MKLIEIVAKDDLLRSWNDYTISDEGDPLDFEYRQISENGVYHSTYLVPAGFSQHTELEKE